MGVAHTLEPMLLPVTIVILYKRDFGSQSAKRAGGMRAATAKAIQPSLFVAVLLNRFNWFTFAGTFALSSKTSKMAYQFLPNLTAHLRSFQV